MLHGLRLIDIGNHKDTTLRLGPVTAILGPNGSGKTTVLNAIEWIGKARGYGQPPFSSEWNEPGRIVRAETEAGESIVLGVFHENYSKKPLAFCVRCELWQQFDLADNATHASFIPKWLLHKGDDASSWMARDGCSERNWGDEAECSAELKWEGERFSDLRTELIDGDHRIPPSRRTDIPSLIGTVRRLNLSPAQLKKPSYSTEVAPQLSNDGEHLASVLSDLMTTDRARFVSIVEALQTVVPSIRDIRAMRCPISIREPRSVTVNKRDVPYFEDREVIGQQLRFDMASGNDLPADRISDGTMLVLAIITLLKTMPGAMILLDDIEQGLHPSAQRHVVQLIKAIQKNHPSMQVVFTTHSPYVVDEMEPEHVWVLGLDKEGCAHARALSEHPKAKKALEVLTTGEFWSAEGEDWVVPGDQQA